MVNRSIDVVDPRTLNRLLKNMRDPDISSDTFSKKLKTVLFSRAYYLELVRIREGPPRAGLKVLRLTDLPYYATND